MAKCKTKSLFGEDDQQQDGRVVRVAFDNGADSVFDYIIGDDLWPVEVGQRVEVPFGRANKKQQAFVVDLLDQPEEQKGKKFRLKSVSSIVDEKPLLDEELMSLAQWISSYYVCPLGLVLSAMVPAAVKKGIGIKQQSYLYLNTDDQEKMGTGNVLPEAGCTCPHFFKVKGKKQKRIVEILTEHASFDSKASLEKTLLLELAGCTAAPLKSLLVNGIVKQVKRAVMRSLPIVPEGLRKPDAEVVLNDDQVKALDSINADIRSSEFGVSLLYGVTDSGKTEVYIRAIQQAVGLGKSAIVLLPEIALTTQTINRFAKRFERIAVLHCQLTASQRNAEWQKIRSGNADVVIGARSAIFAPVKNLGLVVVDEEHEPSFKQDTAPRYNGRDVAIKRSHLASGHCLLGSATPSLETLHNTKTKDHFKLLELPKRVKDLPQPEMKVVDMSIANSSGRMPELISGLLETELNRVIGKGEQAILLLNRRGYSNFVFCPSCRHTLHCNNCDVTLTFHKRKNIDGKETVFGQHMPTGYAICHYCMAKTLVPKQCPLCSKKMTMIGLGAQRLEEELRHKLKDARIARVDSDSMEGAGPEGYYKLLADFADGSIDILAGTQILAKGLHFPNVTLVGIISADTSLSLPDFRANERTFQLISQVAGRAGRSEKGGKVIVQTFLPSSKSIKYAVNHDFDGFVKEELEHRKQCGLPPVGRMAIVGLRDEKFDKLNVASEAMGKLIDQINITYDLGLKIRGPMPATINRIGRQHRMQIVVQAPQILPINRLFAVIRATAPIRPAVKITYDVDPINIL